jgi:hypothetical protein
VPTAGISLIRAHTEAIKPPRALWVPFELGRPLGTPNNIRFQSRVLLALLKLFEAPEGPLLEDFPDIAPESGDEETVLACPVDFTQAAAETENTDHLRSAFHREITAMRPWYDMAVAKRKRTTVGVSGIELENLGDFIYTFIKGPQPKNPREDMAVAFTLKLAIEDLRSYYIEGVTVQPGQEGASSKMLKDWFWNETMAGKVLLEVVKACKKSPDKDMNIVGSHYIVPTGVLRSEK